MMILKAGRAQTGGAADEAAMAEIRRFARGELDAADVYTFPLILCDNEVDREGESFERGTLGELAEMFVGKTGICDHDWRSGNQVARIFRTEVISEPGRKTAAGEDYFALKAWAYMLRSEANAALIADIEAGIKKEVSVGCAVRESVCSICGAPAGSGCGHTVGERYGGKLCYVRLCGAADAYEWSFVAVPAQRGAGVTKALGGGQGLAGFIEGEGRCFSAEFGALQKEAALGRRYLGELRAEVKRLALICGRDLHDALAPGLEAMDAEALGAMKAALSLRAAERVSPMVQLPGVREVVRFDGDAYLV